VKDSREGGTLNWVTEQRKVYSTRVSLSGIRLKGEKRRKESEPFSKELGIPFRPELALKGASGSPGDANSFRERGRKKNSDPLV